MTDIILEHGGFLDKYIGDAIVAARLQEQIGRFSGELSKGLPKVSKRLVSELVYGIQANQSVVLTKVGRVLEENISIKKTEERLTLKKKRSSLVIQQR